MDYYLAVDIPFLELRFLVCVGRGVVRWFSGFLYVEVAGRSTYYLSADIYHHLVVDRNIYYPWAMIEGGRGLAVVWRPTGLFVSGRPRRSRVANLALAWLGPIGERLHRESMRRG